MKPSSPIVLPRPNLGPEPWPDPPLWPWLVAAGVLIRGRLARPSPPEATARQEGRGRRSPARSRDRRPRCAPELTDRVRSALVRAFGPGWRARTTEEVAASPDLAARFGEEVAGRVVDYLRAVDRAKFSADPAGPPDELDWWAARFAEEVEVGGRRPPPTARRRRRPGSTGSDPSRSPGRAAALDDGEVVRDERVVDRDPVRRPGSASSAAGRSRAGCRGGRCPRRKSAK